MVRPLIGISSNYNYDNDVTFIKPGYYEAVNEVGGTAVLLPVNAAEEIVLDLAGRLDGFIISGGPDADARFFGEENLPFNQEISPYRDNVEMLLIRKALELNKPILGICRGIQLMNIVSGGTIYQDIEKQRENVIKHSQQAPKWYPTHNIAIEEDSRIWDCFKSGRADVNSFHHQAVKDTAPGYRVTSRTSDGIIESIEHKTHKFAVGVQWHPELMWKQNHEFLNIFRMFVDACKI
ncbi:MAG: gamma-glutamyl-gamma-aminobutyrate hydrolase family protein [Bacillota bacterium]|nr:gamma-glutamyl-gamma-aminobutyrate hydrolase family protein [Bacillota bacterium]